VNLRSACIQVIALSGGKLFGASWLDPVMGVVGAIMDRSVARVGEDPA